MRASSLSLLAFTLFAVLGCSPPPEISTPRLSERLGADDAAGFARAQAPRTFIFPTDHGPHRPFRNEWWYFTGNLQEPSGRRLGYQATFFRIALEPHVRPRPSAWGTRDVWMAHLAVSDATQRTHVADERFAREANGLAGYREHPFSIWLEDWRIERDPDGTWRIQAQTEALGLSLELTPLRPPVLQGEAGLSRKSQALGNASYYYSMPRLASAGTLRIGEQSYRATGLSWLDREWSTSALAADQAGWDWFALQFETGEDLMFYRLRRDDDAQDPMSAGSLTRKDGTVEPLRATDVRLQPLRWWRSDTGIRYPVHWRLTVGEERAYEVEAVFDAQLMDLSVRYWEGMVTVRDAAGQGLVGRGYMELAGY